MMAPTSEAKYLNCPALARPTISKLIKIVKRFLVGYFELLHEKEIQIQKSEYNYIVFKPTLNVFMLIVRISHIYAKFHVSSLSRSNAFSDLGFP
jgi:hypothetical protein